MPRKKKSTEMENPAEKAIKAARAAYDGDSGKDNKPLETINGDREDGDEPFEPLPTPRQNKMLLSPVEWANQLTERQIEAWAKSYVATGKNWQYFQGTGSAWIRENLSWRSNSVKAVSELPWAQECIERFRTEYTMSTLERRKKLKEISEAPEHPMKGLADNLKAIELDSKEDPESMVNKQKDGCGGLTFNAPVSLFFMPSTQVRAIEEKPALNVTEAIEVKEVVPAHE